MTQRNNDWAFPHLPKRPSQTATQNNSGNKFRSSRARTTNASRVAQLVQCPLQTVQGNFHPVSRSKKHARRPTHRSTGRRESANPARKDEYPLEPELRSTVVLVARHMAWLRQRRLLHSWP